MADGAQGLAAAFEALFVAADDTAKKRPPVADHSKPTVVLEEAEAEAAALLLAYLALNSSLPLVNAQAAVGTYLTALASELPELFSNKSSQDTAAFADFVIGRFLTFYRDEKNLSLVSTSTPTLKWTARSIRNRRRKMEDRYAVVPELNNLFPRSTTGGAYFGVFDGHAGSDVAQYAATHLHHHLAHSTTADAAEALSGAFDATERAVEAADLHSGSTAVCALLSGDRLHVAWTGDSLAALLVDGRVNVLTDAHSPDNEDEHERVVAAGGFVMSVQGELRVNGVLNVSRSLGTRRPILLCSDGGALGDVAAKPMVSSTPATLEMQLNGTEDLLILASDGFWNSVDEDECYESIRRFVNSKPLSDYDSLSGWLVEEAKKNDADDNITVLIVYLNEPNHLWNRLT